MIADIDNLYSQVCSCDSAWERIDAYDVKRRVKADGFGFENIGILGNSIYVSYEKGSFDPGSMKLSGRNYGGFGVKYPIGEYNCFVLRYEFEFIGAFSYALGGKLHGIYGGVAGSGGVRSDGYNGFSLRLIWDENGKIYPYVYHVGMGEWGSKIGNGFFADHGVNKVQIAISLNNENDFFSFIINDKYYEKDKLIFSKSKIPINGIFFSTFFGGNSEKFGARDSEKIKFGNFLYKGC